MKWIKKQYLLYILLPVFILIMFLVYLIYTRYNSTSLSTYPNKITKIFNQNQKVNQKKKNHLESRSFYVGVVRTTQDKNKSILNFYDKKLNFIKSIELPYGALADYMTLPAVNQNFIYFIPGGTTLKESEAVIRYDLSTQTLKEYDIGMPSLLQVTASEDAIFTVNELNFTSYITKYITKNTADNMKQKFCTQVSSKKFSYDTIYYYNGFLYVTGKTKTTKKEKYYLFQLDADTLQIIQKADITNYGQGNCFFLGVGEDIYFTLPYDKKEEKNNVIMKFSTKKKTTKQLEKLKLPNYFPQQIKKLDNLLLVSHCDLIEGTGNSISIFDLKTKKTKLISFAHRVSQIEVDAISHSLYILGDDKLYHYTLNTKEKNFLLEEKITVSNKNNDEEEKIYYYTGVFFLLNR